MSNTATQNPPTKTETMRALYLKYKVRTRAQWEGEFYRYNAFAAVNGALEMIVCLALGEDIDGEVDAWLENQEAQAA